MRGWATAVVVGAIAALVGAPAAAQAVPDCDRQPAQRVLVSGRGKLESVTTDERGHLFFTDSDAGQLLRMNRRHDEPRVLVGGIRGPGGLAWLPDGSLLVGYGDSIQTAANGEQDPQAGLIRVDPKTGENSVYADGMAMANGVVHAPNGAIYGSADVGTAGIDRVLGGDVTVGWAKVESPNGLVVDTSEKWLYAAQTFVPAAISRVEIANPSHVEQWFKAPQEDFAAGLDGMTRDADDNLYVAANGGGAVWRVDTDAQACALAHMPPLGPSAVAFGSAPSTRRGRPLGFGPRNLYVTTFQGELIQLKNVLGAQAAG
jgi:sugar lactone lactonase YvrE